ncbi:hypothetical protein A3E49_02485 [Candidatus Saccharibacteria bacterium RIFCSPHIGHO2_12_FULL_49_19]|nr:MAG: hypothetical protein A2708_00145 [Candidatus Saccharibacteria bacterium RIFCSPHIGHO2_01_FULL_49_21]OGL37844.1 MAG: hypothetical protein A3E49_02485 [Candidatus Saccharibacteria bacterium RIFCSPHIGHO2_12_FULL_49_19]OGL38335.1 MAG: hypothetical protein A3B63_03535 [Candidatus Saccharibacteria bacterium RIFCSPLOWO2_01_FULL_49_22]
MTNVSQEKDQAGIQNENWLKRHKTKMAVGAAALSLALPMAFQPMSENRKIATEAAPWVATGLVASEAVLLGGAAIMLAAAGSRIGNPLRIRGNLHRLKDANGTNAMRVGYAVHIAGAASWDAVLSVGVLELPKASWGLMAIPAYSVAITGVRAVALWPTLKKPSPFEAPKEEV